MSSNEISNQYKASFNNTATDNSSNICMFKSVFEDTISNESVTVNPFSTVSMNRKKTPLVTINSATNSTVFSNLTPLEKKLDTEELYGNNININPATDNHSLFKKFTMPISTPNIMPNLALQGDGTSDAESSNLIFANNSSNYNGGENIENPSSHSFREALRNRITETNNTPTQSPIQWPKTDLIDVNILDKVLKNQSDVSQLFKKPMTDAQLYNFYNPRGYYYFETSTKAPNLDKIHFSRPLPTGQYDNQIKSILETN